MDQTLTVCVCSILCLFISRRFFFLPLSIIDSVWLVFVIKQRNKKKRRRRRRRRKKEEKKKENM